jgi:hypothetical protein
MKKPTDTSENQSVQELMIGRAMRRQAGHWGGPVRTEDYPAVPRPTALDPRFNGKPVGWTKKAEAVETLDERMISNSRKAGSYGWGGTLVSPAQKKKGLVRKPKNRIKKPKGRTT